MLIISYDISDNKKRANFAKYIKKFGYRLQYSVYNIDNSAKILNNIITEIENKFKPLFEETDSIYIFNIHNNDIKRYGYASHEESDLIII